MHNVSISKTPTPDTVRISCEKSSGTVWIQGQFAEAIKFCPMCGELLPDINELYDAITHGNAGFALNPDVVEE